MRYTLPYGGKHAGAAVRDGAASNTRVNSTILLLPPLYSLSPVISTPSARDAEVNAAA